MKKEFFGFYDPTKEEIESAWTDGVFVFDANALLNLYRYSESTREDFFKALNNLADKLFMPYQVGFEFHSNKTSVIKGLESLFDTLPRSVEEVFKTGGQFDSIFQVAKRHPSIEIEAFKKLKDKFIKSIKEELDSQKSSHPDFSKEDTVLDRLTTLFEGKVGKPFSEEQLEKIFKEGELRYVKEIPPGYKDLQTKRGFGNQRIYGDLIIWKQLIDFAKEKKKPIILITDDRKEDWWTKEGGETIRPRQELIKEFFDQTGIRILIYTADRFLKFAKERGLINEVTEESIIEVREIRKEDESLNKGFIGVDPSDYRTFLTGYKSYQPITQPSILDSPSYFSSQQNIGLNYDPSGSIIYDHTKPYLTVQDLVQNRYNNVGNLGVSTPSWRDLSVENLSVSPNISLEPKDLRIKISDFTTDDLPISNGKKNSTKGKEKK